MTSTRLSICSPSKFLSFSWTEDHILFSWAMLYGHHLQSSSFSSFLHYKASTSPVPLFVKCEAILTLVVVGPLAPTVVIHLLLWVPLPAFAKPELPIILQSVDPVVAPGLQPHALICSLLLGPLDFTFSTIQKIYKSYKWDSHRWYESFLPRHHCPLGPLQHWSFCHHFINFPWQFSVFSSLMGCIAFLPWSTVLQLCHPLSALVQTSLRGPFSS